MSKKTFTGAPKPKQLNADAIQAYEQGGTGHDQRSASAPAAQPAPAAEAKEPTVRINVDLPASAHRRFKTACSATSRKMAKELADFVVRRTAELEAEAGISPKE